MYTNTITIVLVSMPGLWYFDLPLSEKYWLTRRYNAFLKSGFCSLVKDIVGYIAAVLGWQLILFGNLGVKKPESRSALC